MKIDRLRLLGFKSFVEPTELVVGTGLTGVVGPNGCGKSNLLEALRWVMGETSYKSMRASAMEDVIFSGTQNRPARNMAEVTIFVDNAERKAPAEFNDEEVLEVTRRIEREAGSAYKVNGKDVRARDVRLLFEDAATGARSPALVRQGRIGEIVNAKPQERRRILEDAAGIAGLHSRRHEAELRLSAAENNLERLTDVMGQLSSQLSALKRQARQARKYKDISAKMRESEAVHAHLQWTAACEQVAAEEAALQEALREVGRLTQAEAEALRAQAETADRLPPLREEEATRGAVLHRLNVERDALDREEARAKERQQELERRLEQLDKDLERERDTIAEAQEILRKLEAEEAELDQALAGRAEAEPAARQAAEEKAATLGQAEAAHTSLMSELAEARAKRRQLDAAADEARMRIARAERQQTELAEQLGGVTAEVARTADFPHLQQVVERAQAALTAVEAQAVAAEAKATAARDAEAQAREASTRAKLHAQELDTEVQTLRKLLKPAESETWVPVLDEVRAAPGYERALGAALGEDLEAPADASAPAHWALLADGGDAPALPDGVEPLARFVEAPAVLARRLAQIGVVEREQGEASQARLKTGQRLVSKQGDLWRWDGYSAAAEAPTAAAQRLSERNRLDDLVREAEAAQAEAAAAADKLGGLTEAAQAADAEEKRLRQDWRAAQGALGQARDELAAAERAAQESNKRLAALTEAKTRVEEGLEEARARLTETEAAIEALGTTEALEARLERQTAEVTEARTAAADARAALEGIERELRLRQERLAALVHDRERWENRRQSAERQTETLTDRRQELREELASFTDLPAQIAERRSKLLSQISQAESERLAAADALAEAETALKTCDANLRQVQAELAERRENRARLEARLEAARERRTEQARTIRDQLECAPEACLSLAGLAPDAELPSLEEIEATVAKLKADRERLGAVNLRAEEESEELGQQVASMEAEKTDLEQAIARLRQGIANLNREGRQRMLNAFDEVNGHFKKLFQTLFGGGEAELQLVESDDPLESGLEILAKPPGKKPQVLTLLSGGEKALTAMALIFAVFLTNPSPICVLDEVDAPLDDSNVERFCNLMDEMRRVTDTRFLIITHHPMTMARMDRLFGVTMSERGVSQLVSVDLETAERFREAG